jgi:hypothetical protein
MLGLWVRIPPKEWMFGVCMHLFCVCVVLCLGRGFVMCWSLVQGVCCLWKMIMELIKRPGPSVACKSHWKKNLHCHVEFINIIDGDEQEKDTCTRARTHAPTRTRTRAHTHTHTHTRARARTHTHTHTQNINCGQWSHPLRNGSHWALLWRRNWCLHICKLGIHLPDKVAFVIWGLGTFLYTLWSTTAHYNEDCCTFIFKVCRVISLKMIAVAFWHTSGYVGCKVHFILPTVLYYFSWTCVWLNFDYFKTALVQVMLAPF